MPAALLNKAYNILGLIKRNFTYMDKNTFINLCKSLVRPSHTSSAESVSLNSAVLQSVIKSVGYKYLLSKWLKWVSQHKTMLIVMQQGQITTWMHLNPSNSFFIISPMLKHHL